MSAVLRILEGTWEEIAQHSRELHGHRLRVFVVDEKEVAGKHPGFDTSPAAVQAWAERIKRRALEGPPIRLGDDSRDVIYEDFLK